MTEKYCLTKVATYIIFLLTPHAWILYHYYSFHAVIEFFVGGISHSGLHVDLFFFHFTTESENTADDVIQFLITDKITTNLYIASNSPLCCMTTKSP
jgi:hypothetical protein